MRATPGEADAFPGLPGVGTQQQPGGKLDASGSSGAEELDPHRQSAGGPEGGGDSVDRRNVSEAEDSGPPNLAAVLPGLADVSIQRVAELTPAAWFGRNQ